ncbi:hypothetical protein [Halioglobus sp. HI00S01]|uniref:hypothetical protein n=1 Tax=Halioglobus sp. HI00S01 TaxID=1822214 RepID=UPI001E64A78B|nr:hypothetical protein [Halioglobus sp. HI00S01]
MSRDDIDHIPSIVPSRDNEHTMVRPTPGATRGKPGGSGGGSRPPAKASSGGGMFGKLVAVVALVVAAVACAWAWQLQEQLRQSEYALQGHETRIADLEARLSDTDEGMSQNAAVQAAKLRELDSEVRKLWDNVWKKSKERLGKLEATTKKQGTQIAANETSISSTSSKVNSAAADLAKLKSVSGDLSRLMNSAKTNQAEVERVADTLNRINLDMAKLNRLVKANEEAVRSTDAFRRQVNASIAELESSVRILQAAP